MHITDPRIPETQQEVPSIETMLGVLLPGLSIFSKANPEGKQKILAQIDFRSLVDQTEMIQQFYLYRNFLQITSRKSAGTFSIVLKEKIGEQQLKAEYAVRMQQLKSLCQYANYNITTIEATEIAGAQKYLLKEHGDGFFKVLQKVALQLKAVYGMEIKVTKAYPYPQVEMKTVAVPNAINATKSDVESTTRNLSGEYFPYPLCSYHLAKLEILAKLTEKLADLKAPHFFSAVTTKEKIAAMAELIKTIKNTPMQSIKALLEVAAKNPVFKTKRRCDFFSSKITDTEKTIQECLKICEKEIERLKDVADEMTRKKPSEGAENRYPY